VIRVLIVEDQTLVREGLKRILSLFDDFEIAGEAADGDEALRAFDTMRPDVVLLDVQMPKRNGIEVLRARQDAGAVVPTIVLTTFDDDEYVLQAVRYGARGFLLKDVTPESLTSAIRTVASGGSLIHPSITERVRRGVAGRAATFDASELPVPLTSREIELLGLLASGFSNREIADSLHIAEGTAKNHVSNILSKLGVRDRTRAVLKAIELGII
jgi:DNA-binding NarL/FixJ family response regulator